MKKIRGEFYILTRELTSKKISRRTGETMKQCIVVLWVLFLVILGAVESSNAADNCKWVNVCTNTNNLEFAYGYSTCQLLGGTYTSDLIKTTWCAVIDRSRVAPGTPICPDLSKGWCIGLQDTPHTGTCGSADVDISNCWNTYGSPFGYVAIITSIDKWQCVGDPDVRVNFGQPQCSGSSAESVGSFWFR